MLPVQVQAFGFAPAFRALVGAELDAQLDRQSIAATAQTDVVDAYGPSVRRLSEAAVQGLLRAQGGRLIALYLGHDGAATMFLTLVVHDAKGSSVAHRSLPLPEEPEQALRSAAERLPELIKELKLAGAGSGTAPAGRGACDASAWQLADASATDTTMQRACAALVIGHLDARLRHHRHAGCPAVDRLAPGVAGSRSCAGGGGAACDRGVPGDPPARRAQISPATAPPGGVSALSSSKDPVLSRVARLIGLAQLRSAPVHSTRDAMRRQAEQAGRELPPLAAAAARALAEFTDPFGEVDICDFERSYPAGMLSPSCRQQSVLGERPPARTASRPESLLFQEWRLASWSTTCTSARRRSAMRSGRAASRPACRATSPPTPSFAVSS